MKAQIPWSVKGVEPGAREAAKMAARRAGLTLGAWLNQIIRDSGTAVTSMAEADEDPRGQGPAPLSDSLRRPHLVRVEREPKSAADNSSVISSRLDALEEKSGRIVRALEATLNDIASRLGAEAPERPPPEDRALGESLARLSARFDALERQAASRSRTLEQGLGEITHRYSDIEARHERGRRDIIRSLERLAEHIAQGSASAASEVGPLRGALSSLETRLDEVSASSRKSAQAAESALNALALRLSAAERRQRDLESSLERALNLFNERLTEALAREDTGQAEALRALEQAVSDIAQHFESIERRREQTNQAVEESLRAIVARIAEADRRQAEEARKPVDALEGALKRVMKRLDDAERRSAELGETLDLRVQELRDRSERAETEFRASRLAIMRAIDDVSDQVGSLEASREEEPIPSFLGRRDEEPSLLSREGEAERPEESERQSAESERAEEEVQALVERARQRARTETMAPLSPEPELKPDAPSEPSGFYTPRSLGAPSAGLRDAEARAAQSRRKRVFHMSLALATGVVVLAVTALVRWSAGGGDSVASGRPSALESVKAALGLAQERVERLMDNVGPGERAQEAPFGDQAAIVKPAESDPKAVYARGLVLARASSSPQSAADAAALIGRAAALGEADAQFALGRLFETGRGLARDRAAAERWYKEAAAQGHALAMYNLGALAASEGDKESYTRAARWFQEAASRGIADAQFNLATLYEAGLGVQADPIEAYAWYEAGAKSGDEEAAQARDRLAQSMSEPERALAIERARAKRATGG